MLSHVLIAGRNAEAQRGSWWRPYARELPVEQCGDGLVVRLPGCLAARIGLVAGDVLHLRGVYPGGMTVQSEPGKPVDGRQAAGCAKVDKPGMDRMSGSAGPKDCSPTDMPSND